MPSRTAIDLSELIESGYADGYGTGPQEPS
jgi:hypothetical protein